MLLLVDDLFMLHQRIFPNQFGIDEIIVFLFYGLLFLVYLLLFRKVILETDHIYLSLTVFFFIFSLLVDLLVPETLIPMYHLFEDGPKFFGIVSWFAYQFSVCLTAVKTAADNAVSNSRYN